MRVPTHGIESIRILSCIQHHPYNFRMPILSTESQSQVTVLSVRTGKQPPYFLVPSQSGSYGQADPSSASNQSLHRIQFEKHGCNFDGAVRIRAMIAKKIDQWTLYATFARHTAGRYQHQRFVQRSLFHTGFENDLRYLNDVARQSATTHRILRHKFQQCWIAKIVPALENHVLPCQFWMMFEVRTQTHHIASIEKFDGSSKCSVFNAFVVRQIEPVGERRLFNMPLQSRPTGKPVLPSDSELRVAQIEVGGEDLRVRRFRPARVKLPDPLRHRRTTGRVALQQIFRLILEMFEIGTAREASYRHDELPFVRPRSAF